MEVPAQLSPELVLVDPELAGWARARLAVRPARPAAIAIPPPEEALHVERHGAFERLLLVAVLVFALVIAFGVAHHEWHYAVAATFAAA